MTVPPEAAKPHMSPLRFFGVLTLVILVACGGLAAGAVAYGREALWTDLFGQPDLGPYDFDLPTRTGKPNDALFCPAGSEACFAADVERNTPVFAVSSGDLYGAVRAHLLAMPATQIAEERPERGSLRAVVRTPLLRFPDTVSVRVREDGPGRSVLWLYSRSQIGHADLGTNERRLRRLVRDLRRALPVVPQSG
jgi:uncharacterized protein (DUF1499 family)